MQMMFINLFDGGNLLLLSIWNWRETTMAQEKLLIEVISLGILVEHFLRLYRPTTTGLPTSTRLGHQTYAIN